MHYNIVVSVSDLRDYSIILKKKYPIIGNAGRIYVCGWFVFNYTMCSNGDVEITDIKVDDPYGNPRLEKKEIINTRKHAFIFAPRGDIMYTLELELEPDA